MPLPTPLQPRSVIPTPQRSLVSRFDVAPPTIALNKRPKASPLTTSNPLSDSDTDSMIEQPPKKKKSAFQKYGEVIGQTKDELQRRDRRMQRFNDIAERGTPPRVDTPDYMRDVQIAASLVCL